MTLEESLFFKYYSCTSESFGIASLLTMEAHDFLGISFLGNETFSTLESTAECANPTHTPSDTKSPSKKKHLFTFSSTWSCP